MFRPREIIIRLVLERFERNIQIALFKKSYVRWSFDCISFLEGYTVSYIILNIRNRTMSHILHAYEDFYHVHILIEINISSVKL